LVYHPRLYGAQNCRTPTEPRAGYESIHKAVQYRNSGTIQIAIKNESDGITINLKEGPPISKTATPGTGDAPSFTIQCRRKWGRCTKVLWRFQSARFGICGVIEDNVFWKNFKSARC